MSNSIDKETGDSGDNEDDKDSNLSLKDADLVGGLINDDEIELKNEDFNEMCDEDEDDWYTSKSCKESLSKVRAHLPLMLLLTISIADFDTTPIQL